MCAGGESTGEMNRVLPPENDEGWHPSQTQEKQAKDTSNRSIRSWQSISRPAVRTAYLTWLSLRALAGGK